MAKGEFSGKTVLVCGVTGAAAACIAETFLHEGANIVLTYRNNETAAKHLLAKLNQVNPNVELVKCNLSCEDDVIAALAAIEKRFGALHIVVNCAGAYPVSPILQTSVEQWKQVIDDNLNSAFILLKHSAQMIKANGGGSIINIASLSAVIPSSDQAHYSTAKAALLMLTKAAAVELAPYNIRVNAISPGLISRAGIENAWPEGVSRWENNCPLRRMVQPVEIAKAVQYLASDNAQIINGQNLVLDGGVTAVHPAA